MHPFVDVTKGEQRRRGWGDSAAYAKRALELGRRFWGPYGQTEDRCQRPCLEGEGKEKGRVGPGTNAEEEY